MLSDRLLIAAIAMLGVLAQGTAPASAAEFLLRLGSTNPPGSAADAEFEAVARAIERDSGGRIEVASKPAGGYGKVPDMFAMVERGDIEMAVTVQGYTPGRFPQSSVMELPLMFKNSVAGTRAMMALYKEGLLDKDFTTVKLLGLYVLEPYPIFTTGRKIETVRQFRGLRIRAPSTTVGLALSKLGAIPLGMPSQMVGETLAGNTLDALAIGWTSLLNTKGIGGKPLADQVSVAVDAKFAAPALMLVMNRAKWDALPPDLQAVVAKHAPALSDGGAAARETADLAAKKTVLSDGRIAVVSLSEAQIAELNRVVTPAIDDWKAGMAKRGLDGEKLYTRARELIAQYQAEAR
jgi:TRAP-type C4-dicarboxylate transport system substrate-binding protein